jgi:hypothetical protein
VLESARLPQVFTPSTVAGQGWDGSSRRQATKSRGVSQHRKISCGVAVGVYDKHPEPFLERLHQDNSSVPGQEIYCAGFELQEWRCTQFAQDLVAWLPDYGLIEEELRVHHGNAYEKLRQAALRVYTSEKYKKRGEAGEIALHAVCRTFFKTIPISPRVFYKSSSNDVVKSFDLVHARFPSKDSFEVWLGESKLYDDRIDAVSEAIKSVKDHIDRGFLTNQKLILGPQIPKSTPQYEKIVQIFATQATLDKFLEAAVFVVGILATSDAIQSATSIDKKYKDSTVAEIADLAKKITDSGLCKKIKIVLIYIPLKNKDQLVDAFDQKLKGLQ